MKKNTYRLTGLLYLLVIIFAGFSQGYVREMLVLPDDAISTANNILKHQGLFRLGLSLDLVAFILDAIISVLLYQMMKPFGKTLAMASSALRLIAHPAIGSLNLLNHFMALHVLSGTTISLIDTEQLQEVSLLFMDAHRNGYLIAGGFFGVHCILLGSSIYRSSTIPKVFGVLVFVSGLGYLIETYGNFMIPAHEGYTALIVGVSAVLGEVSLAFYLLFKGSKT